MISLINQLGLSVFSVSQPFGVANSDYKSGIHNGIDIACGVGTPIYAPCDSVVVQSWKNHPAMGNAILLELNTDEGRRWLRILHLSRTVNRRIFSTGEVVCYSGNTGLSTGPHIHLEVWSCEYDATILYDVRKVRKYLLDPASVLV